MQNKIYELEAKNLELNKNLDERIKSNSEFKKKMQEEIQTLQKKMQEEISTLHKKMQEEVNEL